MKCTMGYVIIISHEVLSILSELPDKLYNRIYLFTIPNVCVCVCVTRFAIKDHFYQNLSIKTLKCKQFCLNNIC